jgi:hypothetical protein
MKDARRYETGAAVGSVIALVTLTILLVGCGAFGVWSYVNYLEQKKNVDSKISEAVARAKLEVSTKDEAAFAQREKEPNRQFVGPSDYGRLTFDYPKTWSAYQATDVSGGGGVTYQAYLNPIQVPPVTPTQKFALRITIEQKTYDQSLASLSAGIKKGDLKTSVYTDGSTTGTRVTGNFTKEMVSTAVIIKMRDRTLTLRTDGDVFKDDFEAILKTVTFNE